MALENDASPESGSVIRPTDDQARRLVKKMIRTARFGALAALEPGTGHPLSSRVSVATDIDGTPVILISTLAAHTRALKETPACSILVGEPGKGDPLAHARATVLCNASEVEVTSSHHDRIRRRYLARHPKAGLYVDFGDFSFFRLEVLRASLNGGFGKAFELTSGDVLTTVSDFDAWAEMEAGAVAHMNSDHSDAVKLYAEVLLKAEPARWSLGCLDPEGLDLVAGDRVERLWFDERLISTGELRKTLVDLASKAREGGGISS